MNGILIINKPEGITSQGVVSKVKKILDVKKVGHTGTLDPLATGVLPILIGNSTKLSKYLIEHDKKYKAIIKLGERTSTGDREGIVIETKPISNDLSENTINNVLNSFLGKQLQKPPMYSAIKIDGKKLYEYAREGKSVQIPKREIEIYEINFLNFNKENLELEYNVKCSKGTYIRTLCEDISEKLGTCGYMKNLVRLEVDKFNIGESYKLEDIESGNYKIIKMQDIFSDLDMIDLNSRRLELFLNGVKLNQNNKDGIYNIFSNKKYIGLGIVEKNLLKRDVLDI